MAEEIEDTTPDVDGPDAIEDPGDEGHFVDETEEKPAEKPAEAEKPGPQWSKYLLDRAQEYGITADEAKGYDSPKALERALGLLDRTVAARFRQEQKPETKPEPKVETPRERKFKLDPEYFDERLVKLVEQIEDHYESQLDELRALKGLEPTVQALAQAEQTRSQAAIFQQLDEAFDEMDLPDVLGKGILDQESEQWKTRCEIASQMDVQEQVLRSMGKPVPGIKELARRAAFALLGEKAVGKSKGMAETPKEPARNGRSGQFVAKPTHRARPELAGEELAKRNLAVRMKAMNIAETDELEGFPD